MSTDRYGVQAETCGRLPGANRADAAKWSDMSDQSDRSDGAHLVCGQAKYPLIPFPRTREPYAVRRAEVRSFETLPRSQEGEEPSCGVRGRAPEDGGAVPPCGIFFDVFCGLLLTLR